MKEAFYFSHDCNASNDPKILAMRSVYRGSGYGWYWILIEMMRQQEDYRLSMKGKYVWNALATQLQCEPDEAHSFITDCIDEFDLFATDGEYFWSESLLRRMKIREEKSDKARQSAMKKWGNNANASKNNANAMRTHTETNANAMRTHTETNANASEIDAIKESKVNKSKVKEIGIPPDGDNNPDQIEKNKTTKTVEDASSTTENQTFVDESDSAKSDGHQPGFSLPTSDNTQDEAEIEPPQQEKIPYQAVIDAWNQIAPVICKTLPKVMGLNDKRRNKIRTRWAEFKTLDKFTEVFNQMAHEANQSSFLRGEKGSFKLSLDWVLDNDNNYMKVLEGQYRDNRHGPTKPTQPKNRFSGTGIPDDFHL
jgi:hypothetical protein